MNSNEILDIIHRRIKKIKKHYKNLLVNFDGEEIHGFRLQMKKLRAFIGLLNTDLSGSKKIKIPKNIKSFYSTAGNIRNLQLYEKRLGTMCNDLVLDKPEVYFRTLIDKKNKQEKKTKRLAGKISFNQFEENISEAIPDRLKARSVRRFIIRKHNVLSGLVSLNYYYDDALHEIRKELKDILYVTNYVTLFFPNYFINYKDTEALTTKLGDFSDLCIDIYFLGSVSKDDIVPSSEKVGLLVIKIKLQRIKSQLKQEIKNMITRLKDRLADMVYFNPVPLPQTNK